ncbi:TIGR03862 family flavoprotein [Saccharibacter sp. 17.LH.SD]|nr:TIGR03862 family flavoprotein [Saccharibacter sp. 17.LH.SD]
MPSSIPLMVIGAGPAGLFAAERLAQRGYAVQIFDHMARPGRKLLMAGRSGLNLTHSESFEHFLSRYGAARSLLEPALRAFPPNALRQWAEELGQPCFTGSSGRIFLKSFKASPLLRAWLDRLQTLGVSFSPHHRLVALNDDGAQFDTPNGLRSIKSPARILALGGASWSRLGSDGHWSSLLPELCTAFGPSNCGFIPDWPDDFQTRNEGCILQGVTLQYGPHKKRGDLILTRRGLEGAPLYALSSFLREDLRASAPITLSLNLRPTMTMAAIKKRLEAQRPRESRGNRLRKALGLSPFSRALLQLIVPDAHSPEALAHAITALPLTLCQPAELDRAISTSGGLRLDALTSDFMIRRFPGTFACGEMLDWEAPTGGYLLQGCFSTATACADGVHHWLTETRTSI